MRSSNVCINCKYCDQFKVPDMPCVEYRCHHPKATDGPNPVTGEYWYHDCKVMRGNETSVKFEYCGKAGNWFEQKEPSFLVRLAMRVSAQ